MVLLEVVLEILLKVLATGTASRRQVSQWVLIVATRRGQLGRLEVMTL